MVKLKLQCKTHPGYTARNPPRKACEGCRAIRRFVTALKFGEEAAGVGGYTHDAIGALDLLYVNVMFPA